MRSASGSAWTRSIPALRFVYEKNLAAFPTLVTTLGWMGRLTDPEFGIDERMVVLADQRVILHQPLTPEAKLRAALT